MLKLNFHLSKVINICIITRKFSRESRNNQENVISFDNYLIKTVKKLQFLSFISFFNGEVHLNKLSVARGKL